MTYSFDPAPYGSHRQILELIRPGSVVLDVGCGDGYLAARLLEKGCSTFGIEVDPDRAALAERYCEEVWTRDVETTSLKVLTGHEFDYLLYADVLEHTRNPLDVLRRLDSYLKEDGKTIICLPNVAHFSVRIPLLFGRFRYEDEGILDRTHLRFFTYDTGRALVEEAGYTVEQVKYTGAAARIRPLKLLPGLFSYQFIFVCSRGDSKRKTE